MKLFISAGEPSGDLHGANLAKALRERRPGVEVIAFGGPKMAAAGADVIYPLCEHAVMGLTGALAAVPRLLGVYRQFARTLRAQRPDAVVLIDYPGFHWWLAHQARKSGVPVIWFVPPQIWAWATHRVRRMQRNVDHVLCTLPFEESWYAERGVKADYIGHPFFDEVTTHRLDGGFLSAQKARPGRIVALLPGSRGKEVKRNGPTLVRVAEKLAQRAADARFLFGCYKESQADWIREMLKGRALPVEVHVGRTPEIMHLAHCCAAVSGSVSLELLYHNTPTVITYRIGRVLLRLVNYFKHARYITLVNLLLEKELFPEYLTDRDESAAIVSKLEHWLIDEPARQQVKTELRELLARVGQPGACGRAADFILDALQQPKVRLAA
jgi:lipid-A-disaccharide synthase